MSPTIAYLISRHNEPHTVHIFLCTPPLPDFFAPAPLPEYAGNPNNNNGWLATDDYLLGELKAIVYEQMVVPAVDEIAEHMVVPAVVEVAEPVVETEEEHDEEYYDGTIQYETRSCLDVVAFACLILLSVTLLRTLHGNGPYGCKFDIMGLLCLKWNVLHVFTVILHNCPLFEILARRRDFLQTYELPNIFVDLFEYHFQVLKMISEVVLQALADHKSIMYGSYNAAKNDDTKCWSGNCCTMRRKDKWTDWNQNGDAVNDNIRGDVRNVIENKDRRGCTYKEFLACNLKGMMIHTRSREVIAGMSWEDFKTLTREEFYLINEMQKLETEFWNHAMVRAGHAAHTDRFHELASNGADDNSEGYAEG
ncbi:hypothetical protein Tco_0522492 [Tanacetum coccineum]